MTSEHIALSCPVVHAVVSTYIGKLLSKIPPALAIGTTLPEVCKNLEDAAPDYMSSILELLGLLPADIKAKYKALLSMLQNPDIQKVLNQTIACSCGVSNASIDLPAACSFWQTSLLKPLLEVPEIRSILDLATGDGPQEACPKIELLESALTNFVKGASPWQLGDLKPQFLAALRCACPVTKVPLIDLPPHWWAIGGLVIAGLVLFFVLYWISKVWWLAAGITGALVALLLWLNPLGIFFVNVATSIVYQAPAVSTTFQGKYEIFGVAVSAKTTLNPDNTLKFDALTCTGSGCPAQKEGGDLLTKCPLSTTVVVDLATRTKAGYPLIGSCIDNLKTITDASGRQVVQAVYLGQSEDKTTYLREAEGPPDYFLQLLLNLPIIGSEMVKIPLAPI